MVQTVIELTDKHALPGWSDAGFGAKLAPYLTRDLLAAVQSGGRIAMKKHINLYDAEFFTGSQGVEHARLFSATVIKADGDNATVEASIGTSDDPNTQPKAGDRTRFQLKRTGGVWKIDDFRNLEILCERATLDKDAVQGPGALRELRGVMLAKTVGRPCEGAQRRSNPD